MSIQLPQLTLQQKWETAESNLIYFVVCGIAYARAQGQTAADFGAWAGRVAGPFWVAEKVRGPGGLAEGMAANKQQFHGFEMEILSESAVRVRGRMRHMGEDVVASRPQPEISREDYLQFFEKKWAAIADQIGLAYEQQCEGDWVVFEITQK